MTMSTPRSPHGNAAGSRSVSQAIFWSPALSTWSSADTSTSSVPSTVSYLSRCAKVLMSPRSLAATTSIPGTWRAWIARQKFRPILPNPLIPTRTVTRCSPVVDSFYASMLGDQHVRGELRLGGRDAKLRRPLVGQCEQSPDPAGDCVLGQRRVGELAELLQAGLTVLDAQPAGHDQVLRGE